MHIYTSRVGEQGEQIILDHLLSKKLSVVDHRDEPELQYRDIDFELVLPNGKRSFVEVKTDMLMHKTGNVIVELEMDRSSGRRDGWFYYCEADYLCYADARNGIAYFFNWKNLKAYVASQLAGNMLRFCPFENRYDKNTIGKAALVNLYSIGRNPLCYAGKIYVPKLKNIRPDPDDIFVRTPGIEIKYGVDCDTMIFPGE